MQIDNYFLSFEIYNVNYKGEVGTRYLGFREKTTFTVLCLTRVLKTATRACIP